MYIIWRAKIHMIQQSDNEKDIQNATAMQYVMFTAMRKELIKSFRS